MELGEECGCRKREKPNSPGRWDSPAEWLLLPATSGMWPIRQPLILQLPASASVFPGPTNGTESMCFCSQPRACRRFNFRQRSHSLSWAVLYSNHIPSSHSFPAWVQCLCCFLQIPGIPLLLPKGSCLSYCRFPLSRLWVKVSNAISLFGKCEIVRSERQTIKMHRYMLKSGNTEKLGLTPTD